MPRPLTIDFVSDIVCPWCVIGLKGLEEALARAGDAVTAEIRFHPFELNPAMAPEGENIVEHIGRKYGATPEQSGATRAMIRERAAALGFTMAMGDESRIYNTFDAHRLLHWAGLVGDQRALKMALFTAYFSDGKNPGDRTVLLAAAEQAGLNVADAAKVLNDGLYAEEVRAEEAAWQSRGIQSVPAIVIDQRYLISGGQPAEIFEQALRRIAAQDAA
ncbi:DsbA family oxidoreductase [Sphingomonas sp. TDK1]|uniref:DsbA family oxidoreductase n=1 Tax=Sphingomonas sp. TDK1 TaxID=453247 RepID=UPI0007D9D07F|nr:DsbA family oxidoreductase [Sphingomonas sp. TDK1]OAN57380.1 disulfide bond formation protein DsbA [Sphingomonas sp. TDK1]